MEAVALSYEAAERCNFHIDAITVRNLDVHVALGAPRGEPFLAHFYCSLHASPDAPPFFQSDTLYFTANPEWHLSWDREEDARYRTFLLRIWCRSEEVLAPLKAATKLLDNAIISAVPPTLVYSEHIDMSHLRRLTSELVAYPTNIVLFSISDELFVTPESQQRLVSTGPMKAALPPYHTSAPPTESIPLNKLHLIVRQETKLEELREKKRQIEATLCDFTKERDALGSIVQRRNDLNEELRLLKEERSKFAKRKADQAARIKETVSALSRLKEAHISHLSIQVLHKGQTKEKEISKNRYCEAYFLRREHTRRLVLQASRIYPIQVPKEVNRPQKIGARSHWTIGGLALPHSDFAGIDEESAAAALGHAAHLTQMLSRYLNEPLRYDVLPRGSRSLITDNLLNLGQYPLYSRGVDSTRFEYGVYLLNKNIEQLVHSLNLDVSSVRETLPNLHRVMYHIMTRKDWK